MGDTMLQIFGWTMDALGISEGLGRQIPYGLIGLFGSLIFTCFMLWIILDLHGQLQKIWDAKPVIVIEPNVYNNRAILEVTNRGGTSEFRAKARVINHKNIGPELYTMYWESNKGNSIPINTGGTESVLVGEIPTYYDKDKNIFWGGISLFKMGTSGEQVFGVSSFEDDEQRRLNKQYPSMAKEVPEDKCVIEVTITSKPAPVENVSARLYTLKIDHDNGAKLTFVSELTPDKEGSLSQ